VRASDPCAIAGAAQTAFTRGTSKSTLELHLEASLAALDDAGLSPADVDAVLPSALAGQAAEDFIVSLGLRDLAYASTLHMAGASLIASVQTACMLIVTGIASCVLVPAGRRGFSGERISAGRGITEPAVATMQEFEVPLGNVGAAQWFAQAAQRHMHEYGTTSLQLGHVAVNSRANANLNPHALMYGRPMTLADHQGSRMITTPFRLLDCSLESDGAGALVITSAGRARDLRQPPVLVAGAAQSHDSHPRSLTEKPRMAEVTGIRVAAQRALRAAGITISDADCLMIHEGFTWYVIAALEALGVVGPGEGGPYVEDGNITLTGATPVNPHGGALSEGHASGVNHVIEAVRQLRRAVEPARQVPGCEQVVVVNEGGFFDGAVLVLRRPR
jgi:acetyl-CoA acetyltransferase